MLCVTYPFLDQDNFIVISKYLLKKKAKVPKLLGYSTCEGLILLEDAGNLFLQDRIAKFKQKKDKSKIINLYKKILIELSTWHTFVDPPDAVIHRFFDKAKLNFEIDFFLERLKIHNFPIRNNSLKKFLREINNILSDPKHTYVFTHRDFHSRNILIKKGKFKIIDYQDARMGLCWYDLSSILFDPYIQLDLETIEILYKYYCKLNSIEEEVQREIFYLQAIQRLTKALGSFLFLGYEKQKPQFFKYIIPALEFLLKLCTLVQSSHAIFLFYEQLYDFVKKKKLS